MASKVLVFLVGLIVGNGLIALMYFHATLGSGRAPDIAMLPGEMEHDSLLEYDSRLRKMERMIEQVWSDSGRGETVVVVVPYRDRVGHLVKFKEYWRWFAVHGNSRRMVSRWEIFILEQFDSEIFNRGWLFNVALAITSGQQSASPDISPDMQIDFACAAIQDIDYLPEKGVDYSECAVPMQLSSE